MTEFLTKDPIALTPEDHDDIRRRIEMDEKRMEEQRRFYEIARQRARELDVHMEKFRRDIVENSQLILCVTDVLSLTLVQMASLDFSRRSSRRTLSRNCRPNIKSLPNGYG